MSPYPGHPKITCQEPGGTGRLGVRGLTVISGPAGETGSTVSGLLLAGGTEARIGPWSSRTQERRRRSRPRPS